MIKHGQKLKFRPVGDCVCGNHSFVTMTRGMVALVSPDHKSVLEKHTWTTLASTHLRYASKTRLGLLHRYLFNPPPGMVVDHINFNGCDNRRENVRICSRQENNWNRRLPSDDTTRGVYRHHFKWAVQCAGKYVGLYADINEARAAYRKAATEKYGAFTPEKIRMEAM